MKAAAKEMHYIICNAGVEAVRCLFKVVNTSDTAGIPTWASRTQVDEPCPDAAVQTKHKVG
jgi:hypothetical protein